MGTEIKNCTFTGVKWDQKATEAIIIVSTALLNLTELFKFQNITILNIESDGKLGRHVFKDGKKIKN